MRLINYSSGDINATISPLAGRNSFYINIYRSKISWEEIYPHDSKISRYPFLQDKIDTR